MTEIVNHSRSTALERSVKILLWGLNRFYIWATTFAFSSAVVCTRQLFNFLPQTSLVLSAIGSLKQRLVSSAILEHTNNNTSRIWLRLVIIRNDSRTVYIYTRQLFSPREGFQTHQCNISQNIKIKQIQRRNNDEDSTVRNNWNAEAKENH